MDLLEREKSQRPWRLKIITTGAQLGLEEGFDGIFPTKPLITHHSKHIEIAFPNGTTWVGLSSGILYITLRQE